MCPPISFEPNPHCNSLCNWFKFWTKYFFSFVFRTLSTSFHCLLDISKHQLSISSGFRPNLETNLAPCFHDYVSPFYKFILYHLPYNQKGHISPPYSFFKKLTWIIAINYLSYIIISTKTNSTNFIYKHSYTIYITNHSTILNQSLSYKASLFFKRK